MTPAPKPLDADRLFDLIRHAVRDGLQGNEALDLEREAAKKPLLTIDDEVQYIMGKIRYALKEQLAQAAERVTCACGHEFEPGDACQGCSQAAYDQVCRSQAAERERRVAELVEAVKDYFEFERFDQVRWRRMQDALAALVPTEKNDAEH